MAKHWSPDEVRALGVRTDLVTAGSVLGIGRWQSYELHRRGEFPVKVLKIGARYHVPVADLLEVLGIADPTRQPAA
ncbi:DNA-binding protein [Gordonia sputi]|uniref:DNA-binding protein n=1 Tax=Gordonia sputi TaxID=36823 RepID=UPI00226F1799|nr:DNA-binding protein [Gordonia sputi]